MQVKVLGVDPGLRHTGLAILDAKGKVLDHTTLLYPEEGKHPTEAYLRFILPLVATYTRCFEPTAAAVEQVGWYRRAVRITLPLSHVAGALVGLLYAAGLDVFLLMGNMKEKGKRPPRGWDEHQLDAALLAKRVLTALRAGDADERSAAVLARRITTPPPVPGRTTRRRKG